MDSHVAPLIARGVSRLLRDMGYGALIEFTLPSGRRLDVVGLGRDGRIIAVEIKSSAADFRSDVKWPEYREWSDALYFAVGPEFRQALLPEDVGLIIADAHGGAILREAPPHPLAPARRKALTLRFALLASERLMRLVDPTL